MSEDALVKIASYLSPIIVVIIGAYINHYLSVRRTRSKDHCEMVEKLVGERDISTAHNLLLETQFQSLYKRQTEAAIIRFLLSCSYPIKRINLYKHGHSYLVKSTDNTGIVTGFDLVPRLRNKIKRRFLMCAYTIAYAGIMMSTIYSLVAYKTQIQAILDQQGYQLLIPVGITAAGLITLAFTALTEAMCIASASNFVEAIKQENKQLNETTAYEETT